MALVPKLPPMLNTEPGSELDSDPGITSRFQPVHTFVEIDCVDMTIAVDWDRKTSNQSKICGTQWLGRNWGSKGCFVETHWNHCLSLSCVLCP